MKSCRFSAGLNSLLPDGLRLFLFSSFVSLSTNRSRAPGKDKNAKETTKTDSPAGSDRDNSAEKEGHENKSERRVSRGKTRGGLVEQRRQRS